MKKKPGVMIYFELQGLLKLLPDAEKGQLFEAILDYGQTGQIPRLCPTLQVAWPLIQQRLDMDTQRYAQVGMKRRYAAYVRWAKEQATVPLSYSLWQEQKGVTEDENNYDSPIPCVC